MMKVIAKLVVSYCLVFLLTAKAKGSEAEQDPQVLRRSGSSTNNNLPVFSDYWTAFLNISYYDAEKDTVVSTKTETGRFSTTGNVQNVEGLAVELVSDHSTDGEPDLSGCLPPFEKNYPVDEPWIAVVRRGKCTFSQKIKNALNLNASGVLVYDNANVSVLQSMKVEWFKIPSVFTYLYKGNEILELMKNHARVHVGFLKGAHCRTETVTRDDGEGETDDESDGVAASQTTLTKVLFCIPPDTWNGFQDILKKQSPVWNWNITGSVKGESFSVEKKTSVLFVSVSFIVLMLISLTWLVFYYIQRFRYIHAKDRLERKLCSQAKRALNIISTNVLKKDDLEMKDFSETCAVCIENYRVADVVRILPCKHQFHKSCIDQWLLEKRTCPMCKMDILKYYGFTDDVPPEDEYTPSLA